MEFCRKADVQLVQVIWGVGMINNIENRSKWGFLYSVSAESHISMKFCSKANCTACTGNMGWNTGMINHIENRNFLFL